MRGMLRRGRISTSSPTGYATIMSRAGGDRYIDAMICEIYTLSVFADLYQESRYEAVRRCHPHARRMVSHNRKWAYVFHIESDVVVVDRILKAKLITK